MTGTTGSARELRLIEVPYNAAGLPTGVARMPAALRAAGLHELLRADGPVSVDPIDVEGMHPSRGPSGLLAEDALVRMIHDVTAAVRGAWLAGARPVVVAGDCSALLGALGALRGAGGGGLVFLDGHEDAWPPDGPSLTGELSDSELGLALGLYPGPAGLADLLPCLAGAYTLVLGPRDAAELADAGTASIADRVAFRSGDWLADAGAAAALPGLVDGTAGRAPAGWWLHVDLDVLSTGALDAVDYPQPGGLTWAALDSVTEAALARPGCRGASVVIYNPDLDGGAAAPRVSRYVARTATLLGRPD